MTNELPALRSRHLRRALSVMESSIAGMADDQMIWAPEGKWSSANLLEHLSLGFLITAKGCRMVLRQGGPQLPRPTLYQRWLAFRVLVLGYFPMRVIAPNMVCPRGLGPEDAKRGLLVNLAEMDRMMCECEEKFGGKREMLSHPYLGPLTIKQWRKFQLFHVRRHMKQLHALRQQMIQASREDSEATVRPSPA
jgi:hypothetical protein